MTNFFDKIKNLLILSIPIIVGNLGQMLIGAGDVFVAAKHSANTLAAISIANAIMTATLFLGLGLMYSISPVLSRIKGDGKNINKYYNLNLLYALLLAVTVTFISLLEVFIIPFLGFNKYLVPLIQDYMWICSFSFIGAYVYQCIKEFLQSHERVFFANMVSIFAIFLNLMLCWVFVFGNNIIPPLGINGLATATLIVRLFMGIVLLIYCRKYLSDGLILDIPYLKELIKIGYPLSLSILLEISAFSAVTLIAGVIGVDQVDAHNIVLTIASLTFMVPMSVSVAIGVKVGYAYGENNYPDIVDYLFSGLTISICIMCVFALTFLFFPGWCIECFTADKNIIVIGSNLLFVVALFQVFDGIQISLSGGLRGLSYTKPIFKTVFISYWLIGIPIGLYLAFVKKMYVFGLWLGLAISLFCCCIIFSLFLFSRLKSLKKVFYR